ncbi:MAG: hypothetical protein JSU05_14940, partial [Bacteroidetes bacterium]|nr:hypothetical protein [Bacteroidota bacterium]
MYRLLIIKRWIEDVCIFPFILIGRVISFFLPSDKEYRIFFFFPFYHIGGAEKVHAQVAMAAGGSDSVIIFTRKSHNKLFYDDFKKSGCRIIDISRYTDNKWLYFLNLVYRGVFSGYINRQQKTPIIFNGQCNFAYKISPWIKDNIKQVELIHSLNTFSYIRIPFLPFISTTVMISKKRIEDHTALYLKKNIPGYFLERIKYIPNSINLPDKNAPDKASEPFRVLYVGRGGMEKRVALIASMAK